jgi:predicted Rossmann-fold nucleotide-binding protein
MKMVICGRRNYEPTELDAEMLVALFDYFEPEIVITGGAVGVDKWATTMARRQGMTTSTHLPDYSSGHKPTAPLRRNEDMAIRAKPDGIVVAFPGNTGTAHMVAMGQKHELALVDLRRERGVSDG